MLIWLNRLSGTLVANTWPVVVQKIVFAFGRRISLIQLIFSKISMTKSIRYSGVTHQTIILYLQQVDRMAVLQSGTLLRNN